ncbi:MAG: VOC family protein [Rhizobiaceae bacterium]|nr:VOC family protein [Rhizobiaceae bacterium]
MIVGFNHTSFTVADVELAVRFWAGFGFEGPGIVEREGSWVEDVTGVPAARIRVAHLYGHGHHLEFIEYAGGARSTSTDLPDRPGAGHICLDVEDIHATSAAFLAAGAQPLGKMTAIVHPGMAPCSAGYLRDPNGIIVELLEVHPSTR